MFKIVEYVRYEKLTWACVDANQMIDGLEGVQKEWVGTELVWSIDQVDDREVEVHFEHRGLVPTFVCYNFCSATWDHYICQVLKKYIESQ